MARTIKTKFINTSTTLNQPIMVSVSTSRQYQASNTRRSYTRRAIISNIKDNLEYNRRMKVLRLTEVDCRKLAKALTLLSCNKEERETMKAEFFDRGNAMFDIPASLIGIQVARPNLVPASLVEEIEEFKNILRYYSSFKPIKFKGNSKMCQLNNTKLKQIVEENKRFKLSMNQIATKYNQSVKEHEKMSTSTLFRHSKYLDIIKYSDATPKKFTISYSLLSNPTKLFLAEAANLMIRNQDFIFVDEATISPHDRDNKRRQICNYEPFLPNQRRLDSIKLIVAMNHRGVISFQTSSENTNQFVFSKFVKELAQRLRNSKGLDPNDETGEVLILDNASWHLTPRVKQEISTQKLRALYLPPYSPHLNAVEMVFGHLKQTLRKNVFETQK